MTEKYILWLPSWYPNKSDAYVGDFIQRHARAASLVNQIVVLYVADAEINTPKETSTTTNRNLIENIISKTPFTGRFDLDKYRCKWFYCFWYLFGS